MTIKSSACTEAQMLIRQPAARVMEAFIDPAVTVNFWFTKSSGKLEVNKPVTWTWEMYNVSTIAIAREIIPHERLVFEWSEPRRTVEINFRSLSDGATYVIIKEYNYDKTGDELIQVIKDSTGGFTTVLDGLKAFLEHGLRLNLIADKYPTEVMQHGNK